MNFHHHTCENGRNLYCVFQSNDRHLERILIQCGPNYKSVQAVYRDQPLFKTRRRGIIPTIQNRSNTSLITKKTSFNQKYRYWTGIRIVDNHWKCFIGLVFCWFLIPKQKRKQLLYRANMDDVYFVRTRKLFRGYNFRGSRMPAKNHEN